MNKSVSVIMLLLLITSMLSLAIKIRPIKAEPKIWTVDDDGPADFHMIQEAINAAGNGDTIFVHNGTYHENVVVNKTISLVGENKSSTIICGNATGLRGVVDLQCENSSITGFTIKNGAYGIRIWKSSYFPEYAGNRIEDNYIIENLYGGILLRGCANNTISNNIIANNTLFGIHLWHAGNNTLINNAVMDNGHGIDFYGNSNDNILRNNSMTNNTYNFGLILRGETYEWLAANPDKPGIVNDVDTSNTVNGKPIYYLVNQSDVQIPPDAGYVWLNNCTNITVSECNLSHNLQGVLLLFCNNVSIINNNIADNAYGIYVGVFSSNNTLIGNNLENNMQGVFLDDFSKFTTMRNNTINGGDMNFGFSPNIGSRIEDWSNLLNDIDSSNTVDEKPIIYWINQHNRKVSTNAGYVMLINSTNITLEDLNLSNNVQNIFLLGSNNTIIANCSVTHSVYGIDVGYYAWFDYEAGTYYRFNSFNTTVKGNMILDNGVGIRVMMSDNSTISNNTLYRNPLGILACMNYGTISRNMVVESIMNATYPPYDLYVFYYPEPPLERSIELMQLEIGGIAVGGQYNIIYGNTIKDSYNGLIMECKIRGIPAYENLVFHNNFINNAPYQIVGTPHVRNNYDNGYPCCGNYWSNYNGTDFYSGPYQNETGSDGIGDTAFNVYPSPDCEVIDQYPLMAPINIFEAGVWNEILCSIDIISNSTLSGFKIDMAQKKISFNVSNIEGQGFCRITIPNIIIENLWRHNYTVLLNGAPRPFRNWTDGTNTYIYINYTHAEHQITIIPEYSSPTIMLLLPAMLIVTLLIKRKLQRRNIKRS